MVVPGFPGEGLGGVCPKDLFPSNPGVFPLSISRISGNAASDKNIKDGVCAQIEKNFARAKWKVGFGPFPFLA